MVRTNQRKLDAINKAKRAWVITQEGTACSMSVIAILSGRISGAEIAKRVEWLQILLHGGPDEHLAYAKHGSRKLAYKANFQRTSTGVPHHALMDCGHNPFLVARLATHVSMRTDAGGTAVLHWTDPDRLMCDPDTARVVDRIPGEPHSAPIRLPLAPAAPD